MQTYTVVYLVKANIIKLFLFNSNIDQITNRIGSNILMLTCHGLSKEELNLRDALGKFILAQSIYM